MQTCRYYIRQTSLTLNEVTTFATLFMFTISMAPPTVIAKEKKIFTKRMKAKLLMVLWKRPSLNTKGIFGSQVE